ncbi:MAG: hypothetical protein MJZ57_07460 [Bacteroidales bacterium]|nr:hypothetical protein [Bacteroidales bacterium]
MRKLIICIGILFAIIPFCFAQKTDDVGKITIGVDVPTQINRLDEIQTGKIRTELQQICTMNSIVSSWSTNSFVVRPNFDIYQFETVEGGMQNIYVVKAELTLSIVQFDETIVNSTSKTLKGSGNTKDKALNDCIANIPVTDEAFQTFLTESKKKIIDYYQARCSEIMLKAQNYAKQEQYETAIAILMLVPEEVPCYESITSLTEEIYGTYQDKRCAQLTSAANAAIAIQDYYAAAEYLTQINPNSSCYSFAVNTFKNVEEKVSAWEQRDWNFKMKQYDDSVQLEKMRIRAAKEIAVEYYKNQPDIHIQQFIK